MRGKLVLSAATASVGILALMPAAASAALFRDQMNNGASWGSNVSGVDTSYAFNYDYSADGIPEAPHSLGSDDATRGVKMEANLVVGPNDPETGEFLTLYPLGQNFTGDHVLRFDAWMNYPIGSDFSTEFLGGGIGYDNVTADAASGAQAIATGDGGSGSDWRAFKSPPQFFIPAADMAGGTRQGSDPYYADFLPPVSPPAAQGQAGRGFAGSPSFQWLTWEFAVKGNDVSIYVEKPNGARLKIVSYDKTDTSDGSAGVNTDGNISLFYADFFSSVSDGPAFQFGIINNVVVGVPEPASIVLLGMLVVGLACVRNR